MKHLVKLLAIVRGHDSVTESDMATMGRVARDTAEIKKQLILDHFVKYDKKLELCFDSTDFAGHIKGLHRMNARNHLEILQALDCMYQDDRDRYGITENFKEYVWAVYRISPPASYKKKGSNLDDF